MTESESDSAYTSDLSNQREGVLLFNEKKYAVGLTWLTSEGDPPQKLIASTARKLKADYCCLRSSIVNQQGYGKIAMGHRMGMPSAASIAVDALVGEWHGIFAADNGWWYLGVFSDAIAPEGDRLFFSEEDAYNFFLSRSADHKWPRAYAPAAWNLPDVTGDIPIEQLLREEQIATSLRPLSLDAFFGGRRRRNVGILALCVFALLTMSMIFVPLILSGSVQDQVGPTLIIRTEAPDIIKPPPAPPVEDVASQSDSSIMRFFIPSQLIKACTRSFEQIIHPLPGWQLQKASCTGLASTADWQRKSGSLDLLQEAADLFPEGVRRFLTGSSGFQASLALSSRNIEMHNVRTLSRDEAIIMLNARFEKFGRLSIRHIVPPPARQAVVERGATTSATLQSPPQYLEMSFETRIPPATISAYFDLPGLRFQNLAWDTTSGLWTYDSHVFIKTGDK